MERGESGRCEASKRACLKSAATANGASPKAQRADPSAEQMDLDEGGMTSSKWACFQGHQHSTPNPNFPPQPVMEGLKHPKVTATRKTARSKKPEHKSTTATKPAVGKTKKKEDSSVKFAAAKYTISDLVIPTQIYTSSPGNFRSPR